MANSTTAAVLHATAIKDHIKKGYVLHMDPDYLLLTYGDITVGDHPKGFVGPRYALCIGVKDDATFWVMLSSKCKDTGDDALTKVQVPPEARVGPWSENNTPTYLFHNQVWVMTKEMATDAHIQTNGVRKTFKHNSVVPRCIPDMPEIPLVYPKNFTIIDRNPKPLPGMGTSSLSLMHELAARPVAPFARPLPEPEPTEDPMPAEAHTPQPAKVVETLVTSGAADRTAFIETAIKLLSNPRLTITEVERLVDGLQCTTIDILLGA